MEIIITPGLDKFEDLKNSKWGDLHIVKMEMSWDEEDVELYRHYYTNSSRFHSGRQKVTLELWDIKEDSDSIKSAELKLLNTTIKGELGRDGMHIKTIINFEKYEVRCDDKELLDKINEHMMLEGL